MSRTNDLSAEWAELDRLAFEANRGNRDAAAEFCARSLGPLNAQARWLAKGALDPEDLAAEAISALLVLWSRGAGPTAKAHAYLVQSMRNRVVDEFRSPRSRVVGLDEDESQLPPVELTTRAVDLHREYGYVRSALASLSAPQQAVLRGIIIDGRKPAELAVELDRPASAVYSLTRRSRLGLRRATLRVMLEEDAPEACRAAADALPEIVVDDVAAAAPSAGMEHIRSCPRCRSVWGRFAAMAGLLGVTTLLVLADFAQPVGAQAAEPESRSPEARELGAPEVAGRLAPAVSGAVETEAGSSAHAVPRLRGASSALVRLLPVGLVVIGGAAMVLSLPALLSAGISPADEPGADAMLAVTAQQLSSSVAELSVDLSPSLSDSRVVLELPQGLAIEQMPAGWKCRATGAGAECESGDVLDGTFRLTDTRVSAAGDYTLTLRSTHEGREISGFAQGQVTPDAQTVRAVAE
ncbi:RNA polymerase sigma factor [Leucobacter luti]|uniref:RNA polymerase sigma factor (Sigma-70 family) n=1 Tax=Leucobacter luti TaxID=340320 RepID=A0A4Q7TPW3_9MICO|nr:sigma-70 family RNA polymerase sigma factor [Leucobacter luti]RZT62816.1 RNA polymerase sigma factor (sigma-70 family) [Leucobacter luti]